MSKTQNKKDDANWCASLFGYLAIIGLGVGWWISSWIPVIVTGLAIAYVAHYINDLKSNSQIRENE